MYTILRVYNYHAKLIKTFYMYGYIGSGVSFTSCKGSEIF